MSGQDLVVQLSEEGQRLDTFLAKRTGITRSQIQRFIEKGVVLVHGRAIRQNYRVKSNDLISLVIPEEKIKGLLPEPIYVEILYRDDHIVVVNKPAGMVGYPSAGHDHGTLMNAPSLPVQKTCCCWGTIKTRCCPQA